MSVTRKIAHNTAIQIVGKAASTLLGLVAVGIMTRYLGTERFGWYTTVISFLQFIGILTDFGLIPVTATMLAEKKFDQETLLKNLLGFRLSTSCIAFAIAPCVAFFLPYPNEIKIAINFSAFAFVAIAINQIFTGYYQTELRMQVPMLSEIASRVILIAGLSILTISRAGFLAIMIVVILANLSQVAGAILGSSTRLGIAFDASLWRAIAHKMWPIAVSIMINVVYLRGDIVLLSLFRSQTEVGLYGAAYRVLDVAAQLAFMIMGIMLPLLASAWSEADMDGRREFSLRAQQSFDLLMFFGIPIAIGTFLLSEKIVTFIAGAAFAEAGSILRILSLAIAGIFLGGIFGHMAVAINRQKQTLWIYATDAAITFLGYLIFIPKFGSLAAALMTVFSELYAGILLSVVISRYAHAHIKIQTLTKILLSTLLMVLVLTVSNRFHVLFQILLGIMGYFLAMICVRGISKETLHDILRI